MVSLDYAARAVAQQVVHKHLALGGAMGAVLAVNGGVMGRDALTFFAGGP